jgi:arylsulfatase A-like enzyme
LFDQFQEHLDEYVPRYRLFLLNDSLIQSVFGGDQDIATLSWARAIKRQEFGYSYSLFLAHLYERIRERQIKRFKPEFPRGLPNFTGDNYFLLEQAVDWLGDRLLAIPRPFLAYLHFLPPHFPYKTHREFYRAFEGDGFRPVEKPEDIFHENKSPEHLLKERTNYDEFILYTDREIYRFFNQLEAAGLLENTWVVVTSDHGELFERGVMGHSTPMLFQPITRIPLVIFEPGRQARLDIHTPTSAADLLPTLLHVTGQPSPDWSEGSVLPPFAPAEPDPRRNVYAVQARHSDQFAPLVEASLMLVKWPYKLAYYFGYEIQEGSQRIDLFDLQADPEELNNLYPTQRATGDALLKELKAKLAEKDQPYR